jgi:DNA-binding MarR family transcriptional regulator
LWLRATFPPQPDRVNAARARREPRLGKRGAAMDKSRMDHGPERFLPLYNQPGHVMRRAQQFAADRGAAGRSRLLTPLQYAVLYAISLKPGMEQQDVAAAVRYDPATTSAVLVKLEAAGAIRREPSTRSLRGLMIFATDEGAATLAQFDVHVQQNQVRLLARLDESERPELLRLMSKIAGLSNSYTSPA